MKAMILATLGVATIAVPTIAEAQRWTPIAQRGFSSTGGSIRAFAPVRSTGARRLGCMVSCAS